MVVVTHEMRFAQSGRRPGAVHGRRRRSSSAAARGRPHRPARSPHADVPAPGPQPHLSRPAAGGRAGGVSGLSVSQGGRTRPARGAAASGDRGEAPPDERCARPQVGGDHPHGSTPGVSTRSQARSKSSTGSGPGSPGRARPSPAARTGSRSSPTSLGERVRLVPVTSSRRPRRGSGRAARSARRRRRQASRGSCSR